MTYNLDIGIFNLIFKLFCKIKLYREKIITSGILLYIIIPRLAQGDTLYYLFPLCHFPSKISD